MDEWWMDGWWMDGLIDWLVDGCMSWSTDRWCSAGLRRSFLHIGPSVQVSRLVGLSRITEPKNRLPSHIYNIYNVYSSNKKNGGLSKNTHTLRSGCINSQPIKYNKSIKIHIKPVYITPILGFSARKINSKISMKRALRAVRSRTLSKQLDEDSDSEQEQKIGLDESNEKMVAIKSQELVLFHFRSLAYCRLYVCGVAGGACYRPKYSWKIQWEVVSRSRDSTASKSRKWNIFHQIPKCKNCGSTLDMHFTTTTKHSVITPRFFITMQQQKHTTTSLVSDPHHHHNHNHNHNHNNRCIWVWYTRAERY